MKPSMEFLCRCAVIFSTVGFGLRQFQAAAASDAAPAPPRLAVLAGDDESLSRTFRDLVTLKLSQTNAVQVVERADLDRLLAEQSLLAGGLMGSNALNIASLAHANGLLFVQQERKGEAFSARLVETAEGYQAGLWFHSATNMAMETLASAVASNVVQSLPKLSLPSTNRLMVSILQIVNQTQLPELYWLESELPPRFSEALSADPGILVLERRQLGSIVTEADISSTATGALRSAAAMIDGELVLAEGTMPTSMAKPVIFVLRVRDLALREIARVQETGTTDKLDELATRAAAAMIRRLHSGAFSLAGPANREAVAFRALGVVWSAETAHTLDPKNRDGVIDLIDAHLKNGVYYPTRPLDTQIESIKHLQRAADLYLQSADTLPPLALFFTFPITYFPLQYTFDPPFSEQIQTMVEPVRMAVREALARGIKEDPLKYMEVLVFHSLVIFRYTWQGQAYMQSVAEQLLMRQDVGYNRKMCALSILISKYEFSPPVLETLSRRPEPEVRFFALAKLSDMSVEEGRRRILASAALESARAIVTNTTFLILSEKSCGTRHEIGDFRRWIFRLSEVCPDETREVMSLFGDHLLRQLEDKKSKLARPWMPDTDFIRYLELMPPVKALEIADRLLGTSQKNDADDTQNSKLRKWCAKKRGTRPYAEPERPPIRLLLAPDRVHLPPVGGDSSAAARITPSLLLVKEDVLWVGLNMQAGAKYGAGLASVDLRDGATKSRCIMPPLDEKRSGISSMCRWRDSLCVAFPPHGVFIVPVRSDGLSDTSRVTCLTTLDGLPSQDVNGVAAVGDNLYLMSGSSISKYDAGAERVILLANLAGSLKNSGNDRPHEINGFVASQTRRCLYIFGSFGNRKIFRYAVDTGEWSHFDGNPQLDNDIQMPQEDGSHVWVASTFTDRRFPRPIVAVFNPDSETVSMVDAGHPYRTALPYYYLQDANLVWYRGGVVTVKKEWSDWDITYIPACTGTPPGTLDWAPITQLSIHVPREEAPLLAHETISGATSSTANGRPEETDAMMAVGATPVDMAAMQPDSEALKRLIDQGANLRGPSGEFGRTPLHYAAWQGRTANIRLLVKAGVPVDIRRQGCEMTPLMEAASAGCTDAVRLLIELGADVNAAMECCWRTPLHIAAAQPNLEVMKLLLDKGSDLEARQNKRRFTPLMVAADKDNARGVRYLLSRGANPLARDNRDVPAAQLAVILPSDTERILQRAVAIQIEKRQAR